MAYLAQYGYSSVQKLMFCCPACGGNEDVSKIFSGKININATAVDRYVYSYYSFTDDFINDFVFATLDMLKNTYGLNLATSVCQKIYDEVISDALPAILRGTYGSFPGTWSMVTDDDFNDALTFVYGGCEEEYAGMIEKLNHYHDAVSSRLYELLTEASEAGIKIGVLTKYGYQINPLFEDCDDLADGASTVTESSFGTTTSKISETLSDKYIAERTAAGFGAYISPDKMVDTSTALFPETTWIVKGLEHNNFPHEFDHILSAFFSDDNCDIHSDARYPQFMIYDAENDSLTPMTENNCNFTAYEGNEDSGYFYSIIRFFRLLYTLISKLFAGESFDFSFSTVDA